MRHHLKLIHLPYRTDAWSAQFQYSEMSMSTEFMFLFCSKCKLLHHQKLHLSQFSENCMGEFAWISELQSPRCLPPHPGNSAIIIPQEKAPPLTVSLARGAWGLSKAHMSALIRRQNLSEFEGARPFVFRAYINCRQSNFLSTMHGSLRKNASATKIDCAFICVKARQCSQVDSCSFTSLPDFPASCEPLADIASSLRNTSPLAASNRSVLLSGVTVNALAFTFRIAYQKAGCSIFVPVLQERKLG